MFERILLAYDGSSQTSAALRQSAELARLCNAELHLLGVVATTGTNVRAEATELQSFFAMERQQIQESLERAAGDPGNRELNVTTCIREGNPATEIAAHAREIKADLAVIGHTDKGLLTRWFLGSTGADLLRKLPCNLLIAAEE